MTWWKGWIAGCLAIACAGQGAMAADASPVNQVFQFAQSGDCSGWSDHSTTHATAYLWIPPECERVRGLVVMCTNVPEQRLVGSEALREICRRHDLGIVWCVPSFMNFKLKTEQATTVGFLQQLLNGLATQSGYPEVASAPVLPVGESGRIFVGNSLQIEGYTGGGGKEMIDGLMSSGDVGRFDSEGRLFVEGRDDDMIVSGGENVFPQEIEDCLTRHDAVVEAAAIGVEDPEFGKRLRAFVVLVEAGAASEADLKEHVKENLARYKVPREIVFLEELPRNATGKILKRVLAEE